MKVFYGKGMANECDILKRFQTISSLRRLIDEIQDPPLLVLEHLACAKIRAISGVRR